FWRRRGVPLRSWRSTYRLVSVHCRNGSLPWNATTPAVKALPCPHFLRTRRSTPCVRNCSSCSVVLEGGGCGARSGAGAQFADEQPAVGPFLLVAQHDLVAIDPVAIPRRRRGVRIHPPLRLAHAACVA